MAKPIRNLKSIKDFISFFEAIPDSKWCTGSYQNGNGQCCALGHLGRGDYSDPKKTAESTAATGRLAVLLSEGAGIVSVNDANDYQSKFLELGATPKERVINYLVLADNGLHSVQ